MRGQRRRDITDDDVLAAKAAVMRENPNGGFEAIARKLGIHRSAVRSRLQTLQKRIEPLGRVANLALSGTSTLFGPDGEVKAQWVKEKAGVNPDQWESIVKEAFADTDPVKPVILQKAPRNGDLLTVYPIGDHHVALYAWGEEAGADYDVKIADKLLRSAAAHLVATAPPSKRAIIVNVGDFFHVDSHRAETPTNKNALDVDTRYAATIRAGVAMLRACIECALSKHEKVEVICSPGNHDPVSALWLSLALHCLYSKNGRVTVHQTPGKFHYVRHGKTLLGVTHGDTVKLDALGGIMASDRAKDWGETTHRYWLTGHIHQKQVLELPGVLVESFRTLAARDAWSTASGYRSGRDMTSLVFHVAHGEVMRNRFDIGMVA